MKKAIYILLFGIFSISYSYSQTSLEGIVTDAYSGEAMAAVTVSLYKEDVLIKEVMTNAEGKYLFSDLQPATYEIKPFYTGYLVIILVDINVREGIRNQLNIELIEHPGLEEIVIIETPIRETENLFSPIKKSTATYSKKNLPKRNINEISTSMPGTLRPSMMAPMALESSRKHYTSTGSSISFGNAYPSQVLPESGQMTAGEWNDLHNWKDWMELLKDENYGIMMERFAIYPVKRYNVFVINEDNAVLANIPVQLLDEEENVLWETYTDNSGRAELWENAFSIGQKAWAIKALGKVTTDIVQIKDGSNTIVLGEECYSPDQMDVVFVVDATSSMNDEIRYLKSELLDVIDRIKSTNEDLDFNLGSVFYRDTEDEYLTRISPLSPRIEETIEFVSRQNAQGGGDNPEAVEAALEETLNLNWRKDALKLVFLILDAPPHEDDATMNEIRAQIKEAALRGIKLIPVTASGIDRNTEFLMKFMAILTNGTYVFITDDSGIGNPHLDPVVDDYEVEKLNDCLVRLIVQYSKSYSCDVDLQAEIEEVEVSIYPNPSTRFINVKANSVPDQIKIYSSNGMLVKSTTPTETETRIELGDLVNGIYSISIFIGDTVETRQVILLK
ncbi:MAG: carboxypeptidase regulatory-like domain-containing protein [Bacteroidota bacterium]